MMINPMGVPYAEPEPETWQPDSSYSFRFKGRLKWVKRAVKFWSGKDGGPIMGTPKPDESWPYGSRQVRRAAMRAMNFRLTRMRVGLHLSRRECRENARRLTVLQWKRVTNQMRRDPVVSHTPRKTFWGYVGSQLANIFRGKGE